MTDFPPGAPLPTHVGSYSRYSLAAYGRIQLTASAPAARTWVANAAAYIPFAIPFAYPISRFFWLNGSTITSTNVDCAVYSLDGIRLASCGSTAASGAGVLQYAASTSLIILPPGSYYFGWTCSNTTSRAAGWPALTAEGGRGIGVLQEASALPLPAAMTPVAWDNTLFSVLCGITRYASGF